MNSEHAPLKPTGRDDIPALLREAASRGRKVLPLGCGSRKIARPCDPDATDVLEMRRLDAIVDVDEEEMILTAEPGVSLTTIQQTLQPLGLMLPPFPAGAAGTLGGAYSDPRESPLAPRWGRTRDHVLGVEAVRGDGTPFKAGGRVVKNVTGYDLTRFLCGARGRFGVVTLLHWRLLPRPERYVLEESSFAKAATSWRALDDLRRSGFEPLLVTLLPDADGGATLQIFDAGREGVIEAQWVERLEPLARIEDEIEDVDATRVGEAPSADASHWTVRVHLPFSAWRELGELPGAATLLAIHPFAHFGRASLVAGDETTLIALANRVRDLGGAVSFEHVPDSLPRGIDPWNVGAPVDENRTRITRLEERLTEEWDPAGTLRYDIRGAP